MTITDTTPITSDIGSDFRLAAVDLYRDIHKGIRAELFAITATAGSLDPADRPDRSALAAHIDQMTWVLEIHAHHEDEFIDPILRERFPALAIEVETDHTTLEARFAWLAALAHDLVDAPDVDARRIAHLLYLELSGFTSRYLRHQLLEEAEIMPALDRLLGPEGSGALHGAIVGSIAPDALARSLAFMLPAMNPADRLEMLGGIRMAAPPEAFDGVVGLARSVLEPRLYDQLATGLGLA
jgi:hypothetical protein